jgi:SAM-dependent methyltransferase
MATVESRYLEGDYLRENPDWHREDARWKAGQVAAILAIRGVKPASVCEVGCGPGDVLLHLRDLLPGARLTGFDVSPQAAQFWTKDAVAGSGIELRLGDFHAINESRYDVITMLDVFEHVRDPFTFLERTLPFASHFVFHVPLDLSASSVVRGGTLVNVRRKVGHIHYYTKDLALATLVDSGYEVLAWRYTGASLRAPVRSLKTRIASLPRRLMFALNRDFGARLLGGETLIVIAKAAAARA